MRLRPTLGLACIASLTPQSALAIQYEVFVEVEVEEDLYDLWVTGQISESTFNALLLLHQTRVELNRAGREKLYLLPNLDYADVDRILSYRGEVGTIRTLGELAEARVLARAVATSLEPFIILGPPKGAPRNTEGFVRAQSRWSGRYDRIPPATAVQARVRAAEKLDSGAVLVLTRNQVRRVRWDPVRRGLSVEPEAVRVLAPKAYFEWENDDWEIVGGTYRIGFGQRLTFDVTDQVTPNGAFGDYELRRENELKLRCKRGPGERADSPCPGARVARVTPDFAWTNRLTGIALGLKHVSAGSGWLQLYAWGSVQPHRAQQIELARAEVCIDPRRDDDPDCAAPAVYVRDGAPSAPASTASFVSLPMVFAEGLGGANVSYFWNPRIHVGITGYSSVPFWLVGGVALDFQELARRPSGGPFGAIGINASYGVGRQQLFAEAARSFDRLASRGGYGLIVRSVTDFDTGELDVSLRYYDADYANPYARPVAAPDELDGLRARDEAGLRLRAAVRPNARVELRLLADGWRRLSSHALHGLLFARADIRLGERWKWALWVEHRNASQRTAVATQLVVDAVRRLRLSCQLQHRRLALPTSGRHVQHDFAAIINATARPIDRLRLRVRVRYDFEDLLDNHRLPQTTWLYADAALTLRERDTLRVRYDLRAFVDQRDSTRRRAPNPEHWLWLEYVFRY